MPPKDLDVKDSDSSADDKDSSRSRTGDDASLKNPDKQSWENQAKEYQRKYTDITEKYDAVIEEMAEIKEKISDGDGTRADRDRLEKLRDRKEAIEDAKDRIRNNPDSKPWLSLTEEISTKSASKTTEDAIYQYDYRQALKQVKRTASELEVEGKAFEDELFEILKGGRWEFDTKGQRVMPTERIENAIDEWKRINKLRADAKKGEEKEAMFAEKGGKTFQRSPSKLEDLKTAKESGRFSELLARKAAVQQEHFK